VAIHADKIMEIKITWTTDDIWDVAEEHDITLSESQADAILGIVGDSHDANIGINWDVILYAIHQYIS
jgi:hypothetical protein